ncbi:hypothetical protein GCM10007291_22430 [Gemmobacter nanjingensis]|jgi:hypothetical protein|uniref:Uncharacterized protein n=1 Tax=Gemmobacter nanjingensis TaxID=488454 RepID=A0ABQ3FFS1_9RHOB|nr:hypothetical protein [Gemmobacter nanjingensis]GHC22474.1 hypothetical protein GCM10007291_22430 [Gemmobacter nanjingensis]
MARTLFEQVDGFDWSDDAYGLFRSLTSSNGRDELGAVVLVSAAVLLARQQPAQTTESDFELVRLGQEFTDLIREARDRLCDGRCRPALRVVGGRHA